ncbi:MAG: SNF2-related protein [Anaeroplasma sp.]
MLKIGDYISYYSYGLAKIIEINENQVTALFIDKKRIFNIDEKSYGIVSNDIIDSLKNENWMDSFSNNTLRKGKDYFYEENVESINIKDNRIYSKVRGTSLYKTDLFIRKNASLLECSCPVGFNCKHAAATLYKLEDEYYSIEESTESLASVNKSKDKSFDFSKLDELIGKYVDYLSFSQINELKMYLLDNFGQSDISKLVSYLINSEYEEFIIRTIIIIIYCLYPYSVDFVIMKYSKNKVFYNDAVCFVKCKKNNFRQNYFMDNKYFYNYSVIYFYLINDQTKLFEALVSSNVKQPYLYEYLDGVTKLSTSDIKNLAYYIYKSEDTYIFKFDCVKMEIEAISKNIINLTFNFPISIIKELPTECQYDCLYHTNIKDSINYVLDYDELKKCDIKKYVSVLAYYFANAASRQKNLIIKKLLTIKDIDYLLVFIEDEFDYNEVDISIFDKFFDIEYKIERNGYICYEEYILKCYNCELFKIEINNKEKYVSNYLVNSCSHFADVFKDIINRKFGNEILIEKEKINNEIKLKLEEKNDNELTHLLNGLKNEVVPIFNMLKQSKLANLECYFNTYETYNENFMFLSFKIGYEKKYVVKNAIEFIEYFKNNEYVKYGKDFSFYHNVDNLEKPYDELINLLMKINLGTSSDRRSFRLTYFLFTDFLNILKGTKIFFNEKEYFVDLTNFNYKIRVDREYDLHTNFDKCLLIESGKGLFIFDKTKGVINKISAENSVKKLLIFAKDASGKSIKRLKQRFIDEIYSRFYQYIDIDENIKMDFILSEITINSYFDIVNKTIIVKTVIYKYEKEISAFDLKQNQDIYKYEAYLNYLSAMGFVDGKLINDDDIYRFYTMDFSELKKLCNVYFSESISAKNVITFSTQTCRINYNNGLLDIFFDDSIYSEEELKNIYDAIRLKKKYIMLKKDTILDINNEAAYNFENTINDLNLDKNHLLSSNQKPIYQVLKAYLSTNNFSIDEHLTNMIDELANFKNAKIELPRLNAVLRKYQIEGFNWLSILSKYKMGGILADDMGLGKTLQIITLLKSDNSKKPSLIVCPKTLLFNWINEYKKFDAETKVIPIYGNSSLRSEVINAINYDEKVIYLSGYESLRNDILLYKGEFNYFILDEAQAIKNIYAGKSQAVKQIKAEHRFALTGTPIENNIIDLWSIFDFIMPGYFEDLSQFKHRYNADEGFIDLISKRVSPFILRRCKKDVLNDLPDKIERMICVEMSEAQRKIYDAYRNKAVNILQNGGTSFDVLQILTRLRQICVDPSMFVDNFVGTGNKILELMNIVCSYIGEGHKIIIFSQFVKALNIIERLFNENKIKYLFLSGETKIEDRLKLVNEFNNEDEYKVFLISLKAGGTGLNLVGADVVIHLDPWWNQAVENQATDRAYRIGQKRNVEVIKLLCEDSIEQRVIELQNIKKDIIDKLISNDDSSISKITRDDLGFILNC